MADLHIETFKENGVKELEIDLPDSILNTATKDITSKAHVVIKREDFEISFLGGGQPGSRSVYNLPRVRSRSVSAFNPSVYFSLPGFQGVT